MCKLGPEKTSSLPQLGFPANQANYDQVRGGGAFENNIIAMPPQTPTH
jgi:hypothetical protein